MVAGLRVGDARAFDAAVASHHDAVRAVLVRATGRREVGEELTQEVFLRLARHAHGLRPDTRLRPWLMTVARNLARSWARWRWLDATAWWAPPDPPVRPDELAAANATQRRLEAALADLPVTLRETATLIVVGGLSPAEAAEVLGERADAVRQRWARAKELLRMEVSDAR